MKAHMLAACCATAMAMSQSGYADTPAGPAADEIYAASCSACHGRTGRGVSVYPSLQNRTAEYITEKLEIYRAGERIGPNSGLMIPNARELTDAEIAALSEFISTTFQ